MFSRRGIEVLPQTDRTGEVDAYGPNVIVGLGMTARFHAKGIFDEYGDQALPAGEYLLTTANKSRDPKERVETTQGQKIVDTTLVRLWGKGHHRPFATYEGELWTKNPESHEINEEKPFTLFRLHRVITPEDKRLVAGAATVVVAAGSLALRLVTLRRKSK